MEKSIRMLPTLLCMICICIVFYFSTVLVSLNHSAHSVANDGVDPFRKITGMISSVLEIAASIGFILYTILMVQFFREALHLTVTRVYGSYALFTMLTFFWFFFFAL